ncbi:UDP-glucose 4-epimerase [Candidatus Nitrosopumilus koreensis AR1]|uniref:UDP-glucose 4-epimerase n=1 Tax=Candidatus Nitrosopumilus koreensis AR1 TaxID=1229908 RepID=K0B3G5_9ARCH|nr:MULTISPECIES: NAD-dependent epimerase/dehydratase family protein [Nitrosopumilus]AFS79999.1 UDP-glucose 4-epimerase [Candidatus Nitrosopumilus koreensis AR1]
MKSKKILITGGAGFIGTSLANTLSNNNDVTIFDNFSVNANFQNYSNNEIILVKGDLCNPDDYQKLSNDYDVVFHLAADPEVRLSVTNSQSIFQNNVQATYHLLEWLKTIETKTISFTSTSAVYGDVEIFPTPETIQCFPISLYAGSKLACEFMISSYCHTYDKIGTAIRLANVVGPFSKHGILFDMLNKLRKNQNELEILGDGTQNKSYLYIDDCISGLLAITQANTKNFQIFNLGSDTQIQVKDIVDIILKNTNLENTHKNFSGGTKDGRGWIGDVKTMLLDISKSKSLGWTPSLNSSESIEKTVIELLKSKPIFD